MRKCRSQAKAPNSPGGLSTLWSIIIIVIIIDEAVFILSIFELVVQRGEFFFVLLVFHLLPQAFQRRFTRLFFVSLNVLEGCRGQIFFSFSVSVIINRWDISRMVIRIRECRGGIDQAEVIWGKSVTHLTSARVKGMAFNAVLHPNRTHGLPKILLGIASNLLSHFFRQGVFSLVLNSDARHRATLLCCGIT